MQLSDLLTDHKPLAIGLGVVGLLTLILVSVVVMRPQSPKTQTNSVTVVSFNDGSNEVTVDRNGTVTIKTPFGTFTQYWDKEKVRSFFQNIDNLDFESLTQYVGTELAISLTASNGQQIIIDTSQFPQDIVDQLQITLENTYEQEQIKIIKNTPTPEIFVQPITNPKATASPKPYQDNPWHQGVELEGAKPFSCEAYTQAGGRRVIISNTLCGQ